MSLFWIPHPLNWNSLFYEDTEEFVNKACENVELYATSFGYSGTYYDYLKDIASEGIKLDSLVNLDITEQEIEQILVESNFKGYRLHGAKKWIQKSIEIIKELDKW